MSSLLIKLLSYLRKFPILYRIVKSTRLIFNKIGILSLKISIKERGLKELYNRLTEIKDITNQYTDISINNAYIELLVRFSHVF